MKSTENKARSSLLLTSSDLTLMLICCTELWTRDSDQSYLLWLSGRIPWTLSQSSSHSYVFCCNSINQLFQSSWHFFPLETKGEYFLQQRMWHHLFQSLHQRTGCCQPTKLLCAAWKDCLSLLKNMSASFTSHPQTVSCDRSLQVRSTKLLVWCDLYNQEKYIFTSCSATSENTFFSEQEVETNSHLTPHSTSFVFLLCSVSKFLKRYSPNVNTFKTR